MIRYIKKKSSKHQYKAEFKNLDDSEVLSSDFSGLKTSAASVTSTASTHYVPKSPIGYDDINFVNFRFSNFFLAQIHLEILYFHR